MIGIFWKVKLFSEMGKIYKIEEEQREKHLLCAKKKKI